MTEVRELPSLPATAGLLAAAVLPGRRRPDPGDGLPDRRALVARHRQDRERLAAYCRVTGFGIRDAVPATWLHVLAFPLHLYVMGQPDFPFPLAGVLHASNQMTLHRPVTARDELQISVGAENLAPHRRGVTFDLVGRIHVDGELVWSDRSVYLARGKEIPGEVPPSGPRLQAPESTPSQQWRLPPDLGRRYAKVSGDHNPIHLSRLTSWPFGFKRPIIHGMWTHARALSALGPLLPETFSVDVAFTKPISLPGRVGYAVEAGDQGVRFAVVGKDKPHLIGAVKQPAG